MLSSKASPAQEHRRPLINKQHGHDVLLLVIVSTIALSPTQVWKGFENDNHNSPVIKNKVSTVQQLLDISR